ncbi:hypothetical protein [Saccharicrinis sp. GN24d3]
MLIKDIKLSTSEMIKREYLFPHFKGWHAFTYHIGSKDNLIEYVKYQEAHHKSKSYKEDYIELINEHNIEFDERYLF